MNNAHDLVSTRAEISKMLTNMAGILLAGTFTFALFAIEKSGASWLFWLLLLPGVFCIVISVVASGKGMENRSSSWYVLQVIFLSFGFLFLLASLPFAASSKDEETTIAAYIGDERRQLERTTEALDALELRILELEENRLRVGYCGQSSEPSDVDTDVSATDDETP